MENSFFMTFQDSLKDRQFSHFILMPLPATEIKIFKNRNFLY
jgi:hypothetical protein